MNERPTWLIALVAGVTGYCLAKPDTLLGAFAEDGLPFILLAVLGLATLATLGFEAITEWLDRREYERWVERNRRAERARRVAEARRAAEARRRHGTM